MSEPVPPDPPRKNANLFERIDYLVRAAPFLVVEALNTRHELEHFMATQAELQASLDALTAATTAAVASISTEIAQLQAAIAALANAAPADLQPQVDQVTAATARLQTAVDALNADDATPTP